MPYKRTRRSPQQRPAEIPKASAPLTNVPPELLDKIAAAVERANAAEKAVADAEKAKTTAAAQLIQRVDEHKSRSFELGELLIEAKKLHVTKETFNAFLDKYVGLKKSRAYDLIRIAGGKTTDEAVKKDQRERKAKSRTKKKQSDSVTDGPVTEKVEIGTASISPEDSADQRRAEYAAAETIPTQITPADNSAVETAAPVVITSEADTDSAFYLKRFKEAAEQYLHRLNPADLETARAFVASEEWKPKAPTAVQEEKADPSILPADGSIPDFLKRESTAAQIVRLDAEAVRD